MHRRSWQATRRVRRAVVVAGVSALVAAAAVGGLLAVGTGAAGTKHHVSPSRLVQLVQPSSGVATPAASSITPSCQLPAPGSELGPTASLPAEATARKISPPGGVGTFRVQAGRVYAVNGNGLWVYGTGGTLQRHITLPPGFERSALDSGVSQPVIDPAGDVYLSSYPDKLVIQITPAGRRRTFDPGGGNPTGIFPLHAPGGQWQLAVSTAQRRRGSYVYRGVGHPSGSAALRVSGSGFVNPEPGGDLLYADGNGSLQTWDPTANRMLREFGSPRLHGSGYHTGGPFAFFYADEAVDVDGRVFAADGLSTLTVSTPAGDLLGATSLGQTFEQTSLTGDLEAAGGELYAETGPPFDASGNVISVIPISTVNRYVAAHQPSLDTLGWGAGLDTAAAGNYFAPGDRPSVSATFASWWTRLAPHLELRYRVWDDAAITAGHLPKATTIRLPTGARALARISLPLPPADRGPGPYEVEALLYSTATSPPARLGAACLPYTVGAAGDRLDLSRLPPSPGAGGPSDNRGAALNAQLGLTGLRSVSTITWSTLLPGCNPASPSPATCGSGALRFGQASRQPYQAAYLADKDHVHYWIQVSGGDSTSMALVHAGLWREDVQALVNHYSRVPGGCGRCAPVTAWEPWNEPNNTGWGNPASYVTDVLAPFYSAVEAARPGDTVIGGSSLGVSLPWWRGLVAAGGLRDMTVAAVHPYTGNNDAWEEDGVETQLRQLQSLVDSKPVWLTEVGWWSDGPYDYLQQANIVTRALIWQRLLHIPVWNYFIDEGEFSGAVSFSLIEAADGTNGDDYVKPSAVAAMAEAHLLSGRAPLSRPSTGIPQTYQARFGPTAGDHHDAAAVWSDGLATTAALTASTSAGRDVPVTVTTQYGASRTVTLTAGQHYALPISDQVTYVTYPAGDHVHLGPTERYGADLALASEGAKATATSGSPSAALGDPSDARSYGQGWTSSKTDRHPSLTVHLRKATRVNRVLVDTQSPGSTASGLRDYVLSVRTARGGWKVEAHPTAQYRHHVAQFAFAPVTATAVRIRVLAVDLGGYYGGGIPPFCTATSCIPTAFVHAVEIYAGSAPPATVDGQRLTRLP